METYSSIVKRLMSEGMKAHKAIELVVSAYGLSEQARKALERNAE